MVLAHNINEGVRTNDIQITQNVTFETMLLSEHTLNGLKASGFYKPSPIQLHAIPLGKCGFDLLLEAKSGTGKTAVFTVIALENIVLNKGLQVLILAPTREIAAQVCDVIKQIGQKFKGLCVEVVMGGLPIQEDIAKFKNNGVHIVVGSPGRLKHLIQEKYIELKSVKLVILDEADKLMEKSFLVDIKYINSVLPKQKQVIMSSATYPDSCKEFINQFVCDAQHICPNNNCILLGVTQKVTFVKHNSNIVRQTGNRFKELLRIISKKQFKQCLIFCNYQARVGEVHKLLTREKWPVEQLYGQQDQNDRLDALRTLQQYKCRILVSTDLAARGIDASNVDLVINFEPPYDWQTYLHRIGRAGRFGSYGMAVTILSEGEEKKRFMNILKPLSTSITLTTMWSEGNLNDDLATDQQSKCSVAVHPVEANNSKEHYFEKFWMFISNTTEPIQLESFDNLVSSYNEVKQPEIESFSDLIASYQAINLNDFENCSYKNIKISNAEFLNKTLQLLKSKLQENLPEISSCDVMYPSHNTEVMREKAIKGNIFKSRHDINDNKINSFCSDCKNNNLSLEGEISHRSLQSKDDDDKELLNMGLPTCFSSFKHKKQSDKKHSRNKQIIQNTQASTSQPKGSKEYNKQSGTSYCKSESIEEKTKNKILSKQNSNIKKRNSMNSTSLEASPYDARQESSSKYINWYNRLKLQVKQIEQIIYIEELNKLC